MALPIRVSTHCNHIEVALPCRGFICLSMTDYLTKQQLAKIRTFVDKTGYIDPDSFAYFICDGGLTISLVDEDGMIADQIAFRIKTPKSYYDEDDPFYENIRHQVNESFLDELFQKENEKLKRLIESSQLANEEFFEDLVSDILRCTPRFDEMIIKTIPKHLAAMSDIDNDYDEEVIPLIKAEFARWIADGEDNTLQNG